MSVLIYRDAAIAGAAASTLIAAQVIEHPACLMGFDYTEGLRPVYRALSRMTADGLIDWSDVNACALCENVRADAEHSVLARISDVLFDHSNCKKQNRFAPASVGTDWSVVCNDFENRLLDLGGLDFAFVAIEKDGSVVRNIGAPELAPVTHVERTENGRVVTVGMSTLMSAKKIVAFMIGADKAEIAPKVFGGMVSPSVPASFLQLHPNMVCILDEDAAAKL